MYVNPYDNESTEPGPISGMLDIWRDALISPSDGTYQRLANDPKASIWHIPIWFLGSLAIGYGLTLFIATLRQGTFPWLLALAIPFNYLMIVFLFIIGTAFTQVTARMIGGTGNYKELFYALSTFVAPMLLLSIIASAIPAISTSLSFFCNLYTLILAVIATKAIHRFGWLKALLAVSPSIIIGLALYAAALAFIAFAAQQTNFSQFFG